MTLCLRRGNAGDTLLHQASRAMLVEHMGELEFGAKHKEGEGWFVSSADFRETWHNETKALYPRYKRWQYWQALPRWKQRWEEKGQCQRLCCFYLTGGKIMKKIFCRSQNHLLQDAIADVTESMRSGWVAMGPKTLLLRKIFCKICRTSKALSLNSATAGLHTSLMALGIGPGDEVITTPMTFASTVNAIILSEQNRCLRILTETRWTLFGEYWVSGYFGDKGSNSRPLPVCHVIWTKIEAIADKHGLAVIEDAAHALGASYKGRKIGSDRGRRRMSVFSFHPQKISPPAGRHDLHRRRRVAERSNDAASERHVKGSMERICRQNRADSICIHQLNVAWFVPE